MIHGTDMAYRGSVIEPPCRCNACRHAHRLTMQAYYLQHRHARIEASREHRKQFPAAKPEPWIKPKVESMDEKAERIWQRLKSDEPRPFRMFRSPLYDL